MILYEGEILNIKEKSNFELYELDFQEVKFINWKNQFHSIFNS